MDSAPVSKRLVWILVAVGLLLAVAPTLLAGFMICGVSGCSGGGFGRSTDPGTTRLLLLAAGAAAALPLAVLALVRRSARLLGASLVLALVVTLVAGVAVGSDLRGCPRGVSDSTCQEESRSVVGPAG